jgi:hypothetical protein
MAAYIIAEHKITEGCCLMMRSSSSRTGGRVEQHMRDEWGYQAGRASSQMRRASARAREGLSPASESAADTARSAGDYAAQMKDRISDTASDYASQVKDTASSSADSVADFADETRRKVMERSARLKRQTQATLQSTMQRTLREQPLAVAVAGLAAGAAVAALFPSTDIEDRAFGGAHERPKEAASSGREGDRGRGQGGERLKGAAEKRGFTSEGLKEMAGEVADTRDVRQIRGPQRLEPG